MAENPQKHHAIMIPYPLQGHVIPFVHLAIKLATKGFVITFVNTQSIDSQISKAQHPHSSGQDILVGARKSGLDIRYATVSDGFPLGFDRSLNHDQFMEGILHVFSAHVDELVGKIVRTSDPPASCLIADTFYVWPSMIADKYKLVNISFWTEPALVLTLYYHLDLPRKNDKRKDTVDYIPGVRAIEPTDLMSYLQATDAWTVVHRIIYKAFRDVKRSDIIISNTVQELEPETISALNHNQPTCAIGPIFPSGFTRSSVATSMWSESDCTPWLGTKPRGSVLYISLIGSYAHTSKQAIQEIAHGLLLSEVSFVWVLRPDIVSSDDSDFLPVGFEENVPLLCFPLLTDQFTNRKLVVDDWRIGLNLCDERSIRREEVATKINCLMRGKVLDELREEIRKVKRTQEEALALDGSSQKKFQSIRRGCEDQKSTKVMTVGCL